MERIVELNRGPFVGARAAASSRSTAGRTQPSSTCGRRGLRRRPRPGRAQRPGLRQRASGRRPGSSCGPDEPIVLHASSPDGGRAGGAPPARGRLPRARRLPRRRRGDASRSSRSRSTSSSGCCADGEIDLIDVREADERDAGYIPGSRHIPYRLLRAYGATVCRTTAGRDDLRERPARGDRRERPRRRRRRRPPGAPRRDRRLAAPRRPHGRVPPLRLARDPSGHPARPGRGCRASATAMRADRGRPATLSSCGAGYQRRTVRLGAARRRARGAPPEARRSSLRPSCEQDRPRAARGRSTAAGRSRVSDAPNLRPQRGRRLRRHRSRQASQPSGHQHERACIRGSTPTRIAPARAPRLQPTSPTAIRGSTFGRLREEVRRLGAPRPRRRR